VLTVFSTLQPVFAAPIPVASKKASRFERIAKKLNLSSKDLTTILIVSPGLFALSYYTTSPALKMFLRIAAIIPPIVAIALPKKAVDAIAKVPGLRQYFHFWKSRENEYCENKNCDGFCTECKAMRIYWMMPLIGIPFLILFIKELAQDGRRRREEQEERIARQCQQCRNREHNQQTPCCNRNICQGCSDVYVNGGMCPFFCREYQERADRLNREGIERERARRERERQERRRANDAYWDEAFRDFLREQAQADRARRERLDQQQREQRQPQRPQPNNHYHILGVAQNASEAEIRRAYRQLALQFHPDRAAANNITLEEANRRMQQLNEANEILSNPEARHKYDQNR